MRSLELGQRSLAIGRAAGDGLHGALVGGRAVGVGRPGVLGQELPALLARTLASWGDDGGPPAFQPAVSRSHSAIAFQTGCSRSVSVNARERGESGKALVKDCRADGQRGRVGETASRRANRRRPR